jgi:LPS-assembly protein
LPLQESWYFLKPRLQVDWLYYALKLGENAQDWNFPNHPNRVIPLYDIDSGLFFDRLLHVGNYTFTQTLEPRAYYLYVPFHSQFQYPDFDSGVMNFSYAQLFRDNRFSGRDRLGDANQISLSLTSRLLAPDSGQEWFRASIGQIFYFTKQRVSLCEKIQGQQDVCFITENPPEKRDHSHFIGQAELHASPLWTSGLFVEWDGIRKQIEQASASLQFHPSDQQIINFNYYWLRHDIAQIDFPDRQTGSLHQADISIFWPINLHWQVLSRWHYDLIERQTIEILGGLEYNACCIALQVVGSRYRQSTNFFYPQPYATGVFAQIVFKGLSAIGVNNPDGKLKQKIPGYIPLYDRQNWIDSSKTRYFPFRNIPLY